MLLKKRSMISPSPSEGASSYFFLFRSSALFWRYWRVKHGIQWLGRHGRLGDACNWHIQQWPPDIVGECLQVLHDGDEMEFVARTGKAPQPHTLETVVRL